MKKGDEKSADRTTLKAVQGFLVASAYCAEYRDEGWDRFSFTWSTQKDGKPDYPCDASAKYPAGGC